MIYLIIALITIFLIIAASIVFKTDHTQSERAKTKKRRFFAAFSVVLLSSWLVFVIEYSTGLVDDIFALLVAVGLSALALAVFFVYRKSIKTVFFVFLLLCIIGMWLFATFAVAWRNATLWGPLFF